MLQDQEMRVDNKKMAKALSTALIKSKHEENQKHVIEIKRE